MKHKIICLILALSMALPLIAGAEPVYETGVSVFLNGEALDFSGVHEPVIKNDITLVPMRVIFERCV